METCVNLLLLSQAEQFKVISFLRKMANKFSQAKFLTAILERFETLTVQANPEYKQESTLVSSLLVVENLSLLYCTSKAHAEISRQARK